MGSSGPLVRVLRWGEWSPGSSGPMARVASPGFDRVGPMVAGVSMLVARVWVWVRWLLGFEHVGTLSVLCLCFVGA